MNRRKFALSWGRKQFFGLSWPLTSLLGLIYLKSFVLPVTFADSLYFAANFIGHYGLLNAIVYFLLFCPIVLLMPSYYIARFWSLLLILALNLFVFADAIVFGAYQIHIYEPLSRFLLSYGLEIFPHSSAITTAVIAGLFVGSILIWIRGETIWRSMGRKFSNPVKNWYLVIIVLGLIVSKTSYHYSSVDHRMTDLFPFDLNLARETRLEQEDHRKFYYPTDKMVCTAKSNPNLIVITVKNWEKSDLNPEMMPLVSHMQKHAVTYDSHYSVSENETSGLFSLYYSIPSSYESSVGETQPAILTELNKRQYEMVDLRNGSDGEKVKSLNDWMSSRSDEIIRPYFVALHLQGDGFQIDPIIQNLVMALQEKGMLKDTHILLTGSNAPSGYQVPLMIMSTTVKADTASHPTSHYDIMPTLMEDLWACKSAFKIASTGSSLDSEKRDWLFLGSKGHEFKILNLKDQSVMSVLGSSPYTHQDSFKPETILEALKLRTKFSKP